MPVPIAVLDKRGFFFRKKRRVSTNEASQNDHPPKVKETRASRCRWYAGGMEKALARMDEKDEDRMAVANLKALCKSVKLCQYLCKAPIRTMPEEEMVASFTELESQQVALPEAMMSASEADE